MFTHVVQLLSHFHHVPDFIRKCNVVIFIGFAWYVWREKSHPSPKGAPLVLQIFTVNHQLLLHLLDFLEKRKVDEQHLVL